MKQGFEPGWADWSSCCALSVPCTEWWLHKELRTNQTRARCPHSGHQCPEPWYSWWASFNPPCNIFCFHSFDFPSPHLFVSFISDANLPQRPASAYVHTLIHSVLRAHCQSWKTDLDVSEFQFLPRFFFSSSPPRPTPSSQPWAFGTFKSCPSVRTQEHSLVSP